MSGTLLDKACRLLDELDCSCVIIGNDGRVTTCHRRGVLDLLELYTHDPHILEGAVVADKVVGKGAAAIMASGHVDSVHSRVMSRDALELLGREGVLASCDNVVPYIVNRAGTGCCPVETICRSCNTAADCIPLIIEFVECMRGEHK